MNHEVLNLMDEALKAVLGQVQHANPRVHVANLLLRAARQWMRSMPYRDYLETEWWAERRQDAIKAAGGRCQLCDTLTAGHVHHRTYVRRGCELLADLVYLCEACHEKFHDLFQGGEPGLLCKLCGVAMVADQGTEATFWLCPSGHGPIIAKHHKKA